MAFRLAIQETVLSGTVDERAAQAQAAGVDAVEVMADGLTDERVAAWRAALDGRGMRAVSVHMGMTHDFLCADEVRREAARDALRHTFARANDLGADAVVMVPQNAPVLDLPDLMPFRSRIELALELMIWHLRVFSDLAYVFDLKLHLQPRAPHQTAFLNRLSQGAEIRRRMKDNPYVLLSPDTYHLHMSEAHPLDELTAHADAVGVLHVADNHGGLAGTGSLDFGAMAAALDTRTGWAVMTAHYLRERPTTDRLAAAVAHLRAAGFSGVDVS